MHPPHGTSLLHVLTRHLAVKKGECQENRLSSTEQESTLSADKYSLLEEKRYSLFF
jgi:hypothetical protein